MRGGRIEARLATSAAAVLGDYITWDPQTGPTPPAMGSDGQSPSTPDAINGLARLPVAGGGG